MLERSPASAWRRDLTNAVRPRQRRELLDRGVTAGSLRGPRWRRVTRGWRTEAGTAPSTGQRILDASAVLVPGAAIGGWAAAYVLGADWLDGIDPHTGREQPVDVIAPGLRRRSTSTVRYRTSALPADDVTVTDGIAITTPVRTAFDGARWATGLAEAVTFLDVLLACCPSALRQRDFLEYIEAHPSWTGIGQACRAGELARPGVRSPWETRLRMCWQVDAELAPPMINAPLLDPDGVLLGIADLFDPVAGLVTEYDGSGHRGQDQHHRDNIREERFEAANLTVVRADKIDIRAERPQLIARLLEGHRRGLARDRVRDRWRLPPGWG